VNDNPNPSSSILRLFDVNILLSWTLGLTFDHGTFQINNRSQKKPK
jgi:hypothetical protein